MWHCMLPAQNDSCAPAAQSQCSKQRCGSWRLQHFVVRCLTIADKDVRPDRVVRLVHRHIRYRLQYHGRSLVLLPAWDAGGRGWSLGGVP